jgi:acetyl esterase/lipase
VAAAVLHYRVAPYRHPVPLRDAQRAMRLVRHRATDWSIDPRRVGILGFSAGGHLAASISTLFDGATRDATDAVEREDDRPDATILCYPVVSSGPYGHQGSFRNLLGDSASDGERDALSLEKRVTARTPPTFLWHTADDGTVPVQNAYSYAMALAENRIPHALHVFPHGSHGLGLAEGHPAAAWIGLCESWLRSVGFVQ